MKTIIRGQVIERTYRLRKNYMDDFGNFVRKPTMKYEDKITYEQIAEVDGELKVGVLDSLYFSETEKVCPTKDTYYRIDLGKYVVDTDKVIKTIELAKKETEAMLAQELRRYNKTMIESNEQLKAYCEVNKLDPEDTDVEKLVSVLYPNDSASYKIVDGRFVIKPKVVNTISASHIWTGSDACATINNTNIYYKE